MIFVLHYLLFNAGLSAIIILQTLYLQTYSDASLTEIGTLLMILPFISIVMKPLFCALADRHRAHKWYLIASLAIMALGYGSLAIAPFFPDFVEQHGRIVWYCDILGIILGFSAFGVAWSLGDALAVNAARIKGVPWGSYRVWATISWGLFGFIVGQINETPILPKYVPAFLMLAGSCSLEIILLAIWPAHRFIMMAEDSPPPKPEALQSSKAAEERTNQDMGSFRKPFGDLSVGDHDFAPASEFGGPGGTVSSAARFNPRVLGALGNILMDEVGDSLRSTLGRTSGARSKRQGLSDILEQHQAGQQQAAPATSPLANGGGGGVGTCDNSIVGSSLASTPLPPTAVTPAVHGESDEAAPTSDAAGDSASGQPPATPISTVVSRSAAALDVSLGSMGGAGGSSSRNNSICDSINKQMGGGSQAGSSTRNMSTLGRSALMRTHRALSRMNSLSSASGVAFAQEYNNQLNSQGDTMQGTLRKKGSVVSRQQMMIMSSLASNTSLGRAAAERAMNFSQVSSKLNSTTTNTSGQLDMYNLTSEGVAAAGAGQAKTIDAVPEEGAELSKEEEKKYSEDLQMLMLKLIVKRDPAILKYLLIFVFIGVLFTAHLTFFFMHLEQICRERGFDFSGVMGVMVIGHSLSEVVSFLLIVPYLMPKIGRTGSMLTIILIFAFRFGFYGTYFEDWSPWWALVTETGHGFAYGMTYSLITEIAGECVDQVDAYLPELIATGIVPPSMNAGELKLPLRATMYGLFSGAFDGLGNGIGALCSGIYLDSHSFVGLWRICTYISLLIGVIYPLTEWNRARKMNNNKNNNKKKVSG